MFSRVAFSLFFVVVACQGERATPDAITTTSAVLASNDVTGSGPATIPEADYRGTFNGANVYVTFGAHGTIASGFCFYDAFGADVPLRGAVDEHGVVMLQEMDEKGPASSITLERDGSGVWFGTWTSHDESRSGSARLEPLVRHAGEPVFVATRHVEVTRAGRCGATWNPAPSACDVSARVPVVLGLTNRVFEHALNQKLASLADMRPPAGDGALIDYEVPLNARGLVSFEISAHWRGPAAQEGNAAAGLTAAVDVGKIADDVDDFVDVPKARVDHDLLVHARGAVLTDTGVAILDGSTWRDLAFTKLAGAMRAGTPFTSAWKR
jgi:hypothetical protein